MSVRIAFSSIYEATRYSTFWDLVVPLVIGAAPRLVFALLGTLTDGLDKPNSDAPMWVFAAMAAVQILGIVSMAIVILLRFEAAFGELALATNGNSAVWRKLALILSIACLLISDILANVSAAFRGSGMLLAATMPFFVAYLILKLVALARLPPSQQGASEPT